MGCDVQWALTYSTHRIFQSTHPSGVRREVSEAKPFSEVFQSTHPSGVRPDGRIDGGTAWDFNPRTPVGCDTHYNLPTFGDNPFQSTHPSGVRLGWPPTPPKETINFNPRTPVGCDDRRRRHHPSIRISIHAPQWGATGSFPMRWRNPTNFNPRTPVGCDAVVGYVHLRGAKFQSTHPSGVRPRRPPYINCCRSYFNPRTPVGCDRKHWRELKVEMAFQSTHPSGVRRRRNGETENHTKGFNPRTPVGCDACALRLRFVSRVSIHAPQWGATARMGIAFHNMEAPPVLKTDFIAKIHVHRSIHKFSNQKHQQTIHF